MQTPQQAVRSATGARRRLRPWRNTHFGHLDAVKAHPLAMCRFRPNEGGTVSTSLSLKLAPASGYMRSKAFADVVQIFVPYQAIEKQAMLDAFDDAGVTEMTRRRLMAKQGIQLRGSTDISRACNIHPRMIGGLDRVSGSIHNAYNAAVNHLRKNAYYGADQLDETNIRIAPAVLTANILERFNGVLDPERHIDGSINLTGELPVKGLTIDNVGASPATAERRGTEGEDVTSTGWKADNTTSASNARLYVDEDDENPGYPDITVDMSGSSEITLRDMMESRKLDGLIRQFAQTIKNDPINGEEAVERALYSISVDFDANCHVLYREIFELSPAHQRPTDGPSINEVSAHFGIDTNFSTIVPRSELGGQLVTLVMVKPLETLEAQPDPAQTEPWELVNVVHDETELDETLLTRADLESGVGQSHEDAPVFWVGHNSLKHHYETQGPNVQQTTDVEMQSSMWTYPVPTSVTPSNVSYPEDGINMYPFYNWKGGHAEYTVSQVAAISTSLAKGPNPVERIQLFADDPSLIEKPEQ